MDEITRKQFRSTQIPQILAVALVLLILCVSCTLNAVGLQETVDTPAITPGFPAATTADTQIPTTVVPSGTPTPSSTPTPSRTPTPAFTPTPSFTPTTPVAVIKTDAVVRRLISGVFAGEKQPLTELKNSNSISLGPNGLVTTDQNGEAEVVIKDCLKLYIFQASSLTRSTCRKSDAASGLGVCGTQGLTGVVNKCTSQVEIQSPSSNVVSKGTWFTVLYLPEDRLTIVQVFEDKVEVQAVINPSTGQRSAGQTVGEGNLWFTSPGANPPTINGIQGRTIQPISVWEALRPELIQKYPNIDLWMNTAAKQAKTSSLHFDNSLVHPTGVINVNFVGKPWDDKRLQEAMLTGVDWKGLNQNLWFGTTVATQIKFNAQPMANLSKVTFSTVQANSLLVQAGYFQNSNTNILILVPEGDKNAYDFGNELASALNDLSFKPIVKLQQVSESEIKKLVQGAESNSSSYLITIGSAGDAFRTTPTP
jgi:hypothetical protein